MTMIDIREWSCGTIEGRGGWEMMMLRKGMNMGVDNERVSSRGQPAPSRC